jgi:hypothetical protein
MNEKNTMRMKLRNTHKENMYSAYNHKRATAAKCRESTTADTTALSLSGNGKAVVASVLRWCDSRHFCSGGALMLVHTVHA